jgi:hypothetical protein
VWRLESQTGNDFFKGATILPHRRTPAFLPTTYLGRYLAQLSNTGCEDYGGEIGSVIRATDDHSQEDFFPILVESAWRLAFTRSGRGTSEGKIIQAINIFYEMQAEL